MFVILSVFCKATWHPLNLPENCIPCREYRVTHITLPRAHILCGDSKFGPISFASWLHWICLFIDLIWFPFTIMSFVSVLAECSQLLLANNGFFLIIITIYFAPLNFFLSRRHLSLKWKADFTNHIPLFTEKEGRLGDRQPCRPLRSGKHDS